MSKSSIIVLSILLALIVVLGGIYIWIINKPDLSPNNKAVLEDCKVVSNNGEGNINIVFFSNKEDAEKYSDALMSFSPLDKNKQSFNLFYIEDYEPECEIYKEIALLCYNKELIEKASSCPNDFIVVLKSESTKIRSSAYMNVMSINSNHPTSVLAHEFGHALVPLAEEYIPAKIPKKAENCVEECSEFGQDSEINGCFKGCSQAEYYRSIESGIMRTLLSNSFGKFNENLILEKIKENSRQDTSSVLTGNVIQNGDSSCEKKEYVFIEGKYDKNKIEIKNKDLQKGCVGKNGAGDFSYDLVLKNDSLFLKEDFNPELIFTDVQKEKLVDGETMISEKEFYLKIPKIENSKTLKISKENKTLTEVNLLDLDSRPCEIN